jgi:DNA-binding NarL/FixJ family response regulator
LGPNLGSLFGDFEVPIKLGGGDLAESTVRILVVEDYESFRQFICATLHKEVAPQAIFEASDGGQAIALARALHPDLILLDIGLPKLNGIEAARRLRELAPKSRILFVSQESSVDVVQEAFSAGASGYVVKTDAARELAMAVKAVLRGERFVGIRFGGYGFAGPSEAAPPRRVQHSEREERCATRGRVLS